jgi:hypothetical protein
LPRIASTGAVVQHVDADDPVGSRPAQLLGGDEVDRAVVLEGGDARAPNRADQRALDLAPRQILRMDDPPLGVASFARQVIPRVVPAGEFGPELDQLPHALRTFADTDLDGLPAAKPRPGHQRVFDVLGEGVLVGEHARDAALGVLSVRLAQHALAEQRHAAELRRLARERQPRRAAAQYDEIKHAHQSPRRTSPAWDA